MPNINVCTIMDREPSEIYGILRNLEKFPEFIRDIEKIAILENKSNEIVITKWIADIDGTPVEWIETNHFNDNAKTMKFCMVKGAFEKYEGSWEIKKVANGSAIKFQAILEWGIPNFEKYIGNILEEKACKSIKGMIWLIKKHAYKRTH